MYTLGIHVNAIFPEQKLDRKLIVRVVHGCVLDSVCTSFHNVVIAYLLDLQGDHTIHNISTR